MTRPGRDPAGRAFRLLMLAAILGACAGNGSGPTVPRNAEPQGLIAGCAPAEPTIARVIPEEDRRPIMFGQPLYPALLEHPGYVEVSPDDEDVANMVSLIPPGTRSVVLRLRAADGAADNRMAVYLSTAPIEAGVTVADFFAAGGVMVARTRTDRDLAEEALAVAGSSAAAVEVGGQPATLVRADPIYGDFRTFNVYWSDGTYGWVVQGRDEASAIVDIARGIACAGA